MGVDPMSEIDPQSLVPAPPPAPEGWVSAPAPAPRPSWGRWLAVGTIAATIVAAGGGIGIGLTVSRYLHTSHPTQSATLPRTSEPSSSTAPIAAVTPSANGTINAAAIAAKVDP